MHVTLLNYTQDAEALLIFTKQARLGLHAARLDEIRAWPPELRAAELAYMADTIPSSWEFVDYVFMIEGVSRAFTHQFVRSRQGSYAQQTMRVLNMGEYDYVYTDRVKADVQARSIVDIVNENIRLGYNKLVELGLPAEDARGLLPTNISTNIVAKFNLRAFVDLAKSRTGGRTQSEYQKVMNAMVDVVLAVHPWAEKFLFQQGRDYFAEIEAFAEKEYGGDLLKKGALLKIVDKMRKEVQK
jgi:flavin-dependent thymidylate synthase